MYTVEQKSMLAKLMASENITVEHRKAKTAKFNLQTRTLTCPVWNDMTGDMYDLLLGHEISHALHTPMKGWHDAVVGDADTSDPKEIRKRNKFKHFLNVVEDARIERFVKDKYPGIRQPMIRAYKQLLARNFFGTANIQNFNSIYLIDKLNLAAKVGSALNIRFTQEEQPFYDELMRVETWEQVESLANRLWEYSKKEQKEKQNQEADALDEAMRELLKQSYADDEEGEDQDNDFDDDFDDFDEDFDEESDEGDTKESKTSLKEDENNNDQEESSQRVNDQQEKDDKKEDEQEADGETARKQSKNDVNKDRKQESGTTGNGHDPKKGEDDEEFMPSSSTDEAFRDNEEKLVDQTTSDPVYAYIPTPNLKDIVVPADQVNESLSQVITRTEAYAYRYNMAPISVAEKKAKALGWYQDFRTKNADYISLLVKEFEMKKAAKRYERKKVAETGDLNLAKIYNYRLEDDIFRKMLITQKGKSHGLVLLLDKSGSMQCNIKGAMEQILILATFCRKVSIPFRAFSFTNTMGEATKHDFKGRPLQQWSTNIGEVCLRNLDFREMFNSDMSDNVFTNAVINHLFLSNIIAEQIMEIPRYEGMGGTPLHEALVALRDVTRQFRKRHRLDIVNTIVIHDGDADWTAEVYKEHTYSYRPKQNVNINGQRVTLIDGKEKVSIVLDRESRRPMTEAFMKWYQMTTGSGIFGFFISSKSPRALRGTLAEYYHNERGTAFIDNYGADADMSFVKLTERLREERFIESYTPGYTRLYLIAGSEDLVADANIGIQDTGKAWTPSRLLTAFRKVNKKKTVSRVLISRFIGMIAIDTQTIEK